MEEEKKLKQSSKQLNPENKDDFWITLSQSLLDAPQTFTSQLLKQKQNKLNKNPYLSNEKMTITAASQ